MHRVFCELLIKKAFGKCRSNVRVPKGYEFPGIENISVGNHVAFGSGLKILTTRAKVSIGNDIMFGPKVTIITGSADDFFTDKDKLPENNQNVILEGDNWIGANVTILKGGRIGYGAVVATGSLINHGMPPFSIWGYRQNI